MTLNISTARGRILQESNGEFIEDFHPYLLSTFHKGNQKPVKEDADGNPLYRIYCKHPGKTPEIRKELESAGHLCYEYDIPYRYRYMIDEKVYCRMPEHDKVMAFDIETDTPENRKPDPTRDKVIGISVASEAFDSFFITGKEREIFHQFRRLLEDYNLSIEALTGYNIHDFDMPFLEQRGFDGFSRAGIYPNEYTGRYEGRDIMIIDLLPLTRLHGPNLPDYKLDTVAEKLFGTGKLKLDKMPGEMNASELEKYAIRDANITFDLWKYFEPLLSGLVEISGFPIQDIAIWSTGQFVEWYLVRKASEQNIFIPNKKRGKAKGYKGAYVHEPIKGLHEDIYAFDFASLYPNVMLDLEISPYTPGFIYKQLKDIMEYSDEIKQEKKKILASGTEAEKTQIKGRYMAVKVLRNSFYGYIGYSRARWYKHDDAAKVTREARRRIHKAIDKAHDCGLVVIYGDTDSVYVKGNKADIEQFREWAEANLMEYEGRFRRGLFITKKKYGLLSDDDEIEVKGLELVRRDWCDLTKETQRNVLRALLNGKPGEAKRYVRKVISYINEEKYDYEELAKRQQITREHYEEPVPPHIKAARQRGYMNIGDIVPFLIVKNGHKKIADKVLHLDLVGKTDVRIDKEYYIHRQILPAVMRLMEPVGIDRNELLYGNKQATLF